MQEFERRARTRSIVWFAVTVVPFSALFMFAFGGFGPIAGVYAAFELAGYVRARPVERHV